MFPDLKLKSVNYFEHLSMIVWEDVMEGSILRTQRTEVWKFWFKFSLNYIPTKTILSATIYLELISLSSAIEEPWHGESKRQETLIRFPSSVLLSLPSTMAAPETTMTRILMILRQKSLMVQQTGQIQVNLKIIPLLLCKEWLQVWREGSEKQI